MSNADGKKFVRTRHTCVFGCNRKKPQSLDVHRPLHGTCRRESHLHDGRAQQGQDGAVQSQAHAYLARGGLFVRSRRWNDGPEKPGAKLIRALPVFMPPSTTIAVPVIQSASSLARKVAIEAISSGMPGRGIGCWRAILR